MFTVGILQHVCWYCAIDYTANPRSAIIEDEELVPQPQPMQIDYPLEVRKLG